MREQYTINDGVIPVKCNITTDEIIASVTKDNLALTVRKTEFEQYYYQMIGAYGLMKGLPAYIVDNMTIQIIPSNMVEYFINVINSIQN